jgi:TonB family protein
VSDVWTQCEGQIVDNEFRLQQYLGGTDDSAVFLTRLADPRSQKAAIKFIPAGTTAELQLSLWRRVMQIAHPNLLRVLHVGRCRLANRDRLYVVMEYAEEDLSQFLPQRALTASETREMLEPVLAALGYLHGKGFVHLRIKPSNIHAIADQLKLSSDSLFSIGENRKLSLKFDVYDAPETAASRVSVAADVWSLGVMLVEALSQRAPILPPGNQFDPIIPDSLPQPFFDIARHTVLRDPKRRWSISEISARLNPAAAAAAAGQSISPLAVPLSSVPAVPAAKLHVPKLDVPPPKAQAQRQQTASPPKQAVLLPNYVIPVGAALLVIAAIIMLPKILGHRAESSSSAATAAAQPAATPAKPLERPPRRENPPAAKPDTPAAPENSQRLVAEKKTAPQPHGSAVTAPIPASVRTGSFPSANASASSGSSAASGEVLDQVLPDVSEKARATIHGVVRVTVRVHADPTGNVSEASLDLPGPSKFFSDLALQSARRWQFGSPEVAGHSVPSEWLIRFEFTPSGVKAFPKQSKP